MFVASYVQVAEHLVQQYNLQMPLYLYLKEYFRQNKKFGSRDRRCITELVFGFYRIPSGNHCTIPDQLLYGSFLSQRLPSLFFEKTSEELAVRYHDSLTDKITWLIQEKQLWFDATYPLTKGIDSQEYLQYLFQEKKVFLRIRKNAEGILASFRKQGIACEHPVRNCLSFSDKLNLDELLPEKSDYVIQDLATQQVARFLNPSNDEIWWDCCAASGGKSLLLLDTNDQIRLYASDIRPSILENYRLRLAEYHYNLGKRVFLHDASKPLSDLYPKQFDHILCDVPCSGSGTWAQAPEQGYFFTEEKLEAFSTLQKQITENVWQYLKPGGHLIYITCSVWEQENEAVIQHLCERFKAEVLHREVISTVTQGGDIIFVSVVRKLS